jgi:hypothetical protein
VKIQNFEDVILDYVKEELIEGVMIPNSDVEIQNYVMELIEDAKIPNLDVEILDYVKEELIEDVMIHGLDG